MKKLAFVPVSNWLYNKAMESSLLKSKKLTVIPNAFDLKNNTEKNTKRDHIRILFGAARLDDPIKGLETLRLTSHIIREEYPEIASRLELAMFGDVKNPDALKEFGLPLINLGVLKGEDKVRQAYFDSDILVSASSYETLPGTLVEAQAYGCIPVSFNQGGQKDIIDHLATGFIADYDLDIKTRAKNLALGILWAISIIEDPEKHSRIIKCMSDNVKEKFSYPSIARKYISLIKNLQQIK